MALEFIFTAFSRLILIRFSIEVRLVDLRHLRKLIYLNFERFFSVSEKIVFEKVVFLEIKKFYGLHDDLKILRKNNPWPLSCTEVRTIIF